MSTDRLCLMIGAGYVARATAPLLAKRGIRCAGTTRSNADEVHAAGIEPLAWSAEDGLTDPMRAALGEATHLLISAAPEPHGDRVLTALGPDIAALMPRLQWAGYLSTTGVYGDRDGDWVAEDSPVIPRQPRSVLRLAAERAWQAALPDIRIFRLAGIYGPGRSALDQLRVGRARRIVKPGHVFSRIHVDDIAAALALSIDHPHADGVFNLADDEPAPNADVVAFAAELLAMAPPPEEDFETAEMSAMLRGFYAESRRVRNLKAKRELGWTPRFPTYKEGLTALL
ncbi:SDR family oxidoreductase [Hyphobacterium sp. SN044]|uniref:SDR family oxidoreductase n=1 Tax=Hyphobacterium sp. SN044 TaxID=2912575 RepID=UPI001F4291E4|nr:SDR family oxidoreductase [Hyphobacterium sp. SN044]MCF8880379.1 SDR family oxidoreductase [Hyphobacterium sp. SN044]